MVSEHRAGDLRFTGIGVDALSAGAAADDLAHALQQWAAEHADSRVLQLNPLPMAKSDRYAGSGYAAMVLITFIEDRLTQSDASQAVAAALEEIHEAQVVHTEVEVTEGPGPNFV